MTMQDSPLVRAAKYGRVLLVDEADKAPLEVYIHTSTAYAHSTQLCTNLHTYIAVQGYIRTLIHTHVYTCMRALSQRSEYLSIMSAV
jgi:hypothetical protein